MRMSSQTAKSSTGGRLLAWRHNFCGQQFQYRRINPRSVNKERAELRPQDRLARETIDP
jgi:hypothetical protein